MCHDFVHEPQIGGFTVRGRGSSDLFYQLDNGGFQVLFQNGCGANTDSHALGTVDNFPSLKRQRRGSKPQNILLMFRMSVTVPLLLRDSFK